ncbi:hypothetical protein LX36DRAFT_673086 [Colletotrichum falcatum]|nr:hypothetical protein LX36DRAFT_673086 [Colletotrichum falcatum]
MPTDEQARAGEKSFIQARDDFIALLSESEKATFAKCSSIAELLQAIENLQNLGTRRSLVTRCLEKTDIFGDTLSPYFRIMEVFCGSNPGNSAMFLGLYDVLSKDPEICSPYLTQYFQKLCCHLFEFYGAVARISSKKVPK